MAGLASTFPFKAHLSRPNPQPFRISSFDSKLFGLRLYNPNFFTSNFLIYAASSSSSSSSALHGSISALSSGGGFSRPVPGDYRRSRDSRQSNYDDDQALDTSTIRSASVRLIDEQQNMVGIVSKSQAIQMVEDAELDLVILSPDADPPVVRIMDYNGKMLGLSSVRMLVRI